MTVAVIAGLVGMLAVSLLLARRDRRRNTWVEIERNDHHQAMRSLRERTTFDDGWSF